MFTLRFCIESSARELQKTCESCRRTSARHLNHRLLEDYSHLPDIFIQAAEGSSFQNTIQCKIRDEVPKFTTQTVGVKLNCNVMCVCITGQVVGLFQVCIHAGVCCFSEGSSEDSATVARRIKLSPYKIRMYRKKGR
ncbi:hypothetical protein EVAR_25759_1 [Eumeta japonica]|uniref:Uncharacterized protein n=1 Tax=Eumeta variegata TaxID=151549 RepID=A0A4C1VA24_EUMVA|nr:hypothetical protein EVAR_25759_1 [Eumeta japonica]